jgi:uncharacterized membrane protein YjjB (DUF3815 family)
LNEASDAIAGVVAGFVAIAVASLVGPLNLNTVVIAALIVLLPGMTLTNAVNELTSRHLVSGTARFAVRLTTILKLTIGTVIAFKLAQYIGLQPAGPRVEARSRTGWKAWRWSAVLRLRRVVPCGAARLLVVMLSAAGGYLIARFGGQMFDSLSGVFLAAFATSAMGNAYARLTQRPGALVRVPGIIMLVPGSIALRGVIDLVQQQNVDAGSAAAIAVLNSLMALVAGLLFGNLLVSARRNL